MPRALFGILHYVGQAGMEVATPSRGGIHIDRRREQRVSETDTAIGSFDDPGYLGLGEP